MNIRSLIAPVFVITLAGAIPVAAAEDPGVRAYGAQHPDCLEWSDGCVICRQSEASSAPACSTAGIACQIREISCEENRAGTTK